MKTAVLKSVLEARGKGQRIAVLTDLNSGEQLVYSPGIKNDLPATLLDAATSALKGDKSVTVEVEAKNWFVQQFNPPLRMIVVGAVHIAQALVPMATIAGYGVTVVDPRRAFANDVRFPDVTVSTEWPDEAMTALAPDARTAVVTLTHDPKLDDPALEIALKSDAFYIGCLGSRKTHAARLERLAEKGLAEVGEERICGPVGLNIGASSPAEIAISIMGQITATLRSADIKPSAS